jgi:class 3 adenylate cyclase
MLPVELGDDELRDAAVACRVAARHAQSDSERQINRRLAAALASDAERYTRLAERFEAARLRPP